NSIKKALTISAFTGPSITLILLFYFVPVILTILIAFTDMDRALDWRFIGLDNFLRLFGVGSRDPFIPRIIKNTVIYVAGALPLTIFGGLFLSILSMKLREGAGLFFRSVFFIPRAIPPVVWGFLWAWSFEGTRYGLFNAIRTSLGLPVVHWLIKYPMLIVILANGFLGISLSMLVFTSAIASIPVDITRAAEIDGANRWQITRFIIIPLLKWPILTMTAWHLMSFANSYVYIMLITGGGPYYRTEVWSLYAYHTAFNRYRYGYGASLTTILIIVNIALLLLVLRGFGLRRMITRGKIEV
ncbi:MAG: inositol-phosphate transport system permease protein, partial [Thermotogota bacterium]|nr:inositol-phosphate transport system permease protein [Thermotogota bacterium]